ncbi:MAG: ATP-dependent sacrificial sulfur transferase LarE [Gammaproteobacteria bacterium]|nr:ATP-dependent sacrificial sulfur transferase LarE [Gammaproteobacteria bacterium]
MTNQPLIASDQGSATGWPDKLEHLRGWLAERQRVMVAVSGGIDSTFLWKVATDVLGANALGVTAVSPSLASWERESLELLQQEIGGHHRRVATDELSNPDYAANPANRCYFCKDTLWDTLRELARREGYACIVDGYNLDDVGDYRPGQDAGRAHQISSPLKIAGFRKTDIRAAAESLGLSIWAKPAMACLSSRFAYGVAISDEGLARVDAAERWLRERGFAELRVRVHADRLARLELPVADLERFLPLREAFVAHLKDLGFLYVSLDLSGFRSGSMNAVLPR